MNVVYQTTKRNKRSKVLFKNLVYEKTFRLSILTLDKTLKGIRGVRPDNQKFLRAPDPRTKYFERLILSFNKLYTLNFLSRTVLISDLKVYRNSL